MNRSIIIAALLLLGLTACGTQPVETASVPEAPQQTENIWGESDFATPSELPAVDSVQESEPMPEPTPTPPPTPVSLTELMDKGAETTLDGVLVESINAGGVTLVRVEDLMEVYPWVTEYPEEDPSIKTYENAYGDWITATMTNCDGLNPPEYPGEGGILFEAVTGETETWLPLRAFCRELGLTLRYSSTSGKVTVQTPKEPEIDTSLIIQGRAIPVLMYHETSDDIWGIEELFVSPYDLREQLQYLYDYGYDPIFFEDLTHLEDYDKPVLLTCDDGYIGNYTYLYPLLQEYNMKATIFVITGMIGDENYMTEEQIQEVSDSGLVSIQSHTVNHYELDTLSESEQRYQFSEAKKEIARITGKIPYVVAYPTGAYNSTTISIGPEYYTFGLKMNGGIWYIDNDYFYVDRSYVDREMSLGTFVSLLG